MTLHLNIEFSLTIFHWLYIILFLFTNYNVFFCSFLYYSSHIDKILPVSSFASLCLETLIYPILVELMDLVNFIIIFVILNLLFLNLLYLVSLYHAVTNKPYTGWTKLHLYLTAHALNESMVQELSKWGQNRYFFWHFPDFQNPWFWLEIDWAEMGKPRYTSICVRIQISKFGNDH